MKVIDLFRKFDKETLVTFEFMKFDSSEGDWVNDLVQSYKLGEVISYQNIDCEVQEFLNTDVLKLFSSDDTSNVEIDVGYGGELGTKVKVTKYTE